MAGPKNGAIAAARAAFKKNKAETNRMINRKKRLGIALAFAFSLVLAACDGDTGPQGPPGPAGADGADGADGATGADGSAGPQSLVAQTILPAGDASCPDGGTRIDSGIDSNGNGLLDPGEISSTTFLCGTSSASADRFFNRIASFPVCSQIDSDCNDDTETASEIVAVSGDLLTLVYTDSPLEAVGFVDISDPLSPVGLGTLSLAGEPTSVATLGNLALVAVNTSADFVNVSGQLEVIDIDSQTIVETITLAGQPDAVAISPDGTYAAIAIENERDEDLGDGRPPQLPAGLLQIIDLTGPVDSWTTVDVDLTGVADLFPGDPEPEYVDINEDNLAVVTLQENNHIVLVDLATAAITGDFSAGTVDLTEVDATEEDPAVISQTENLAGVPREPDGVSWIGTEYITTADEGDLDGGSRGFTVFDTAGNVVFTSGNENEHAVARIGHYPDGRSENKGNEPENAGYGVYGADAILVIASERSSVLFVYDATDPTSPELKQVLPAGLGPEGVLPIPGRNLLVAASEEDARDDKFRSVLNIYVYSTAEPRYPTISSADRLDGSPIPWGAMSGLAADATDARTLYAIEDSFYGRNRILGIDITQTPAELDSEINIVDPNGVFAAIPTDDVGDDNDVFSSADLDALINDDDTVNIDPEGIAAASAGGFWVASEGAGTVGDIDRPVTSLNFVFKTDSAGVIEDVILLPDEVNAVQLRFGFEGIAEYNGSAYVAFQREWDGEENVRIGIYDTVGDAWTFLYYPLDDAESQFGGWVGLSDLTSLGNGEFLVVERDNQGGPDAAIKRLYKFDVTGLAADSVVTKELVLDLVPELAEASFGPIPEKVEGSAVTANGDVYIVNDNDGIDDNNGETQLINLGQIL
jgi:hypothetical protein